MPCRRRLGCTSGSCLGALTTLEAIMRIKDRTAILEPRDYGKVLEIAYRLNTTYYDAAYIAAAAENKLILVTDGKRLLNKVKEHQKIIEEAFGTKLEVKTTEELL